MSRRWNDVKWEFSITAMDPDARSVKSLENISSDGRVIYDPTVCKLSFHLILSYKTCSLVPFLEFFDTIYILS